eukprot:gene14031-biopygen3598
MLSGPGRTPCDPGQGPEAATFPGHRWGLALVARAGAGSPLRRPHQRLAFPAFDIMHLLPLPTLVRRLPPLPTLVPRLPPLPKSCERKNTRARVQVVRAQEHTG